MTVLKTMLFHDEITDNFDVASCAQKIASWDTIRSSSDYIQKSIINYCKGEVNSWSRIRFFFYSDNFWTVMFALIRISIHCKSIEEAYSSPGSCAIESTVMKIKYFAARCIFNSLWSNIVFRIDILRQSARSPCQLFIYLFVLCLWLYSCLQIDMFTIIIVVSHKISF